MFVLLITFSFFTFLFSSVQILHDFNASSTNITVHSGFHLHTFFAIISLAILFVSETM